MVFLLVQLSDVFILSALQVITRILPLGSGEYLSVYYFLLKDDEIFFMTLLEISVSLAIFISIVLFLKKDIIYTLKSSFSNYYCGIRHSNFFMFIVTCLFVFICGFYKQRFHENFSEPFFMGITSVFCGIFLVLIYKIGFIQNDKKSIKLINAVAFGLMQFWGNLPGSSVLNTAIFSGFCCGFNSIFSVKYALAVLAFSSLCDIFFSICNLSISNVSYIQVDYLLAAFVLSLFISTKVICFWKNNFVKFFKYLGIYCLSVGTLFILVSFFK